MITVGKVIDNLLTLALEIFRVRRGLGSPRDLVLKSWAELPSSNQNEAGTRVPAFFLLLRRRRRWRRRLDRDCPTVKVREFVDERLI